jgi:hypothetical protein
MPLSASDLLHNADTFRRAYPNWPHPEPEERAMTTCTKRECIENECPACLGLGQVPACPVHDGAASKPCPRCGGRQRKSLAASDAMVLAVLDAIDEEAGQ